MSNCTNGQIAKMKLDFAKGKMISGLTGVGWGEGPGGVGVREGVLRKENLMNVEFVSISLG